MLKNKLLAFALFFGLSSLAFGATIIDNPSSQTINVNVSNKSVNRIVLPNKILDTSYSKEKGISVQISGNEAFIKYVPTKKEKVRQVGNRTEVVGKPEFLYNEAKGAEIFFITEGNTYAFALNPVDMEAETIIVNDFTSERKEILKYETENDYVATLSKITQQVLANNTPQGYKLKEKNKKLKDLKDISISYKNYYEGVLYSVHLLEVKNKTKEALILNPKEFISYAEDSPKSISIYYDNEVNHLLPLGYAKVVIITKVLK